MSEQEKQLETLKDIRMELHIVGERLQNPLAALDALKSIDAKLKVLIENASKEQEARSVSNRDTQFAGFAEKVYQEIEDLTCSFSVLPSADEMKRLECEIYARRAYDLVEHATWHIPYARELDDVVSYVGDLTELPKEREA